MSVHHTRSKAFFAHTSSRAPNIADHDSNSLRSKWANYGPICAARKTSGLYYKSQRLENQFFCYWFLVKIFFIAGSSKKSCTPSSNSVWRSRTATTSLSSSCPAPSPTLRTSCRSVCRRGTWSSGAARGWSRGGARLTPARVTLGPICWGRRRCLYLVSF